MKILFWVPYPSEGASNRYRVEQYLPYFRSRGIGYCLRPFWTKKAFSLLYKPGRRLVKFCYFLRGTLSRFIDILTIYHYDAVFIHREAYPIGGAFFENLLAILKKPFIFDFDDAIFLPATSWPNSFIVRYKNPKKLTDILKTSCHVIAGNNYLAGYALRYNSSVSIIPTPIDTNKYFPQAPKSNKELIIGWIGSITTLNFLNDMKKVFIKLSQQFPQIKFKIVGGSFAIDGLHNIVSKNWSMEDEISDLGSFDIGLMPMPDDEWTRGKCGFKAILYMSMGIPCVCSPIGVNKEIIKDGINGFLAASEEEWLDKLTQLINDANLRQRIGAAGRKTVEENYSLLVNVPRFLEVLNKACKC
jgi:glycosyltransferase involved in cell wall biosynthesis